MIAEIQSKKTKKKITMLTAYDFHMARILNNSGIDILLVGDSLGMVVLGYKDTRSVTMEDMIRHGAAVVRGVKLSDRHRSLVVVDMPVNSCVSIETAIVNCKRIVDETGCDAVKIEGAPEIVRAVVESGVEVMAHTGLKPQTAEKFCVQGVESVRRKEILKESEDLSAAGAFALVLECIPSLLANEITGLVSIPTIGIGAGVGCDGQVLVINDLLGIYDRRLPKFVRPVIDLNAAIADSVSEFKKNVESVSFPNENESY